MSGVFVSRLIQQIVKAGTLKWCVQSQCKYMQTKTDNKPGNYYSLSQFLLIYCNVLFSLLCWQDVKDENRLSD